MKHDGLCLLGATDAQLGESFGVSERTINTWKGEHPAFLHALKRGKSEADVKVAGAMYEHAQGSEWVEEQAIKCKRVEYKDGKRVLEEEYVEIVEVTRRAPPDTTSGIFWLKNRQPQLWRDRQSIEHTGPDGGPIMTVIEADGAKERLFDRLAGIAERIMERLEPEAVHGNGDGTATGAGARALPSGPNGAGAVGP